MHQIMIALFVLLWLITDIHVATGICIALSLIHISEPTRRLT